MDLFHMMKAVLMQGRLLPTKSDMSKAMHEIVHLSEVSVTFHARALAALLQKWDSRGDQWAAFVAYFVNTYIDKLKGWWGDYLGLGTPRTTGGGRWPNIHRTLGGKSKPQRLITDVVNLVGPLLAANLDSKVRNRPLEQQQQQQQYLSHYSE